MSTCVSRCPGVKVRFQGMTRASKGAKAKDAKSSGGLWPPEPAPLARPRPGYSSSGCSPAEPDSASPGNTTLACLSSLSTLCHSRWSDVRTGKPSLAKESHP
jgi:hypothetical protein